MRLLLQLFLFSLGSFLPLTTHIPSISTFQHEANIYGVASWYSETDPGINLHTANGEIFDDSQMTCAAWDLPFGTRLEVTNRANGKSILCRVNDRGPARRLKRVVDLTRSAFAEIASPRRGLVDVSVSIAG